MSVAEAEQPSDAPRTAPQDPPVGPGIPQRPGEQEPQLAPWGQPQWGPSSQPERWGRAQWGPAPEQNPLAIIGFVCSLAGLILLVAVAPFTFGLSMLFSAPLSIGGLVCGLLGRQKVDHGELSTGRGLAQAGFVLGIVGIVLHVLAVIAGLVLIGLLIEWVGGFGPPEIDQPPVSPGEPS